MAQAVEQPLIPPSTIKTAFDMIDTNGDGNLQKDEFNTGCASMGFGLSPEELHKVFSLIDADGSGEIDYNEFSTFLSKPNDAKEIIEFRSRLIAIASDISPASLRNGFDIIDKNGDGQLQKSEFSEGCIAMGIKLNDKELNEVFSCIDVDGSGEIDFDEFCDFLKAEKKNNKRKEFGQFRQQLLNVLFPVTDNYYSNFDFQLSDIVIVLQTFNGDYIAVNNNKLDATGKNNDEITRFLCITEGKNDADEKQFCYLKNVKSNNYITISDNGKSIGLNNQKTDESKLRVRRVSNGCYKLESASYKGCYISFSTKDNALSIGNGGPQSRLRCFRKGIKPIFSEPYLFTTKKTVILETKLGQHLRIEDDNSSNLNVNGGKGILGQFDAEPEDGGKFVRLKNTTNGKYLRINDKSLDCAGVGGNLSKFIVHCADGPNHVRLESVENKGSFIGIQENGKGVRVGDGDKFCLFTVYYNS